MSYANINNVVLTGRLTSDPDLHVLPSGNNVCRLRGAVNTRRRNPAGEWSEKPNSWGVAWSGPPGETAAKPLHRGRPVASDGRLAGRAWEPADGRNAQSVSII